MLREIREGEVLLESDAPYFPPVGGDFCHPQYIGEVARAIADVQGRSVGDVIEEASRNRGQLYN